ncbi:2-amino-4-hydroxy-6-hydroxymethyldihydropteridine diphosphokinase [Candidatus Curculioniphilus buchneri]|uniref:2-amino-4-hydroxy-6- hydroxymethyldihydropteridine diphosphokinase n=1 Tax=Candidatus Curculioniphilus buchneri TaxID=690594 RepID=UPI00376F3F65
MERVWLALGSNMSEPIQQINIAINTLKKLSETKMIFCSSYYRSRPLGLQNQPAFLNAVVIIDTSLSPEILLDNIQTIELRQGRIRNPYHRWGPRNIDLDILLFGNHTISTPRLTIPHYDMHNREFVLYPLAEITPNLCFPNGSVLTDCLRQVPRNGLTYWNNIHQYTKF